MSDDPLARLRLEYDRLRAALDSAPTGAARAALKQEIVGLFRRAESAITELASFKESIRDLVAGFKALPDEAPPRVAVRHDHIGASTFIERGWSELAVGHWAAAEGYLREALRLDPDNAVAASLLGWALMRLERDDEALGVCHDVLLRDADFGLARVAVGAVCLRKGIVGEAIEHLTRAAVPGGDPRAVLYANYWLGVAYLEREMDLDAVEFFRRAVTLGPNLAEGWADLGRALWFRGDRDGARDAWTVGGGIRHAPQAVRCRDLLDHTMQEGTLPRSSPR